MQYVNNDMDDQFRRAAEDYPLDTGSMDWNRVLSALEEDQPRVVEQKENKKRRFLWLLLLLPLFFVCNRFGMQIPANGGGGRAGEAAADRVKSNEITHTGMRSFQSGEKEIGTETPSFKNEKVLPGEESTKQADHYQLPETRNRNGIQEANRFLASGVEYGRGKKQVRAKVKARMIEEKATSLGAVKFSNYNQDRSTLVAVEDKSVTEPAPLRTSQTGMIAKQDRMTLPALKESFGQTNIAGEAAKAITVNKPRKFYVGAFGGGDITTIRFQKTSRTGYGFGLAAGYRLNSKWSLEVAASSEKKFYYSDGRYLDPKRVYQAPSSKITEAEGSCRMLDLSVGALYNLRKRNGGNWFAAGGLSSYIMKREDYAYTYYYYQSGASHVYEKEYVNATNNLASVASLSIGYRQYFGKGWQLRVEPFVKVPLKGLGYVNLPFMSAGVRAGIYKDLF